MRAVLILVLGTALASAQHGSSTAVNPYTTPLDAAAGAAVFRGRCAGCHGIDGGGTGAGPSLNKGVFRHGRSDEDLFGTITKGVPGTSMPAFALGGRVTWQVVTHLRTLAVSTQSATGRGNAASGAKLFASRCAGCHMIDGNGGTLGPDLSDIAAQRSELDLVEAMTRPSSVVSSEYWSVLGRTKAGAEVRGVRLNEDTYSVQIRATDGRLFSVMKQNLAEWKLVRESPMPSFEGKLTKSEMDDVISFLASRAKRGDR